MSKVLIPTLEAPDAQGGIARYIRATVETLPEDVAVLPLASGAFGALWRALRAHPREELWIHHVLPVGTVAWLQRRAYVVFLHGLDFDLARRNAWKRALTKRILRGARRIVTNSHALAAEVAAFAGVRTPLVVSPCVDEYLLAAADTPQLPLHGSHTTRLLTVSRLVEKKGHLKVLRAMVEVPNTVYDIVGEGPMRDAIAVEAEHLGLSRRVHLHGAVDDEALARHYAQADIFVMPTTKSAHDREGFGTVYLEANLFDLPVIAVDAPGVNEAVIHGSTGLLIDDTHDALVGALLRLSQDAAFAHALGMQGRERVLAEFTREAQFGTLRQLL